MPVEPRAVVLVEGASDRGALEALAARRGRDLAAEGVAVVPIGGAQAIGRHLRRYGPPGLDLRLAGLYDAGEEHAVRRALEGVGLGPARTRADLERLGFFVCERDLEDELIRALGAARVEERRRGAGRPRLVPDAAEAASVAGTTGRGAAAPLLRAAAAAGRSATPRCSSSALDLARVPRPLDGVLASV